MGNGGGVCDSPGAFTSAYRTGLSVTEAAEKAISRIISLSASIGIPVGLKSLNVKEEDLKLMAEHAKKDACQLTNPRTATLDQVIDMFKAAM